MNKGIRILFIAFIAILASQIKISATHIVGGTITYRHIEDDMYEVDFTFRRDCYTGASDAQFDNQAIIYVFDDEGNIVRTVGIDGKIVMNLNPDDTLNTFVRSDCGFIGTEVCVHETIYREQVRLPYRPGGYQLVYQRCCRNETLANIVEPDNTGGTWMTVITEESLASHNNSPEFKQWPDVYVCANEDLNFDHSATDPEGDSLVYRLYTPLAGLSDAQPVPFQPPYGPYESIEWNNGYSAENMLGSEVPLTIDSQTGLISGVPEVIGQYLVGVLVEEYRDGKLIGTVRRDFQYNVRTCIGRPEADFVANGGECNGPEVTFENTSSGGASSFMWNFNYPSDDPQYKSTEENPTFTYDQEGIYQVQLIASRGNLDSCRSEVIKSVAAIHSDIEQDFDLIIDNCEDGGYRLQLTDKSIDNEDGEDIINRQWVITQNGNIQEDDGETVYFDVEAGEFIVEQRVISSSGCETLLNRSFDTDDFVHDTDFEYELVECSEDNTISIRFIDLSATLNEYDAPESITWNITSSEGTEILNGSEILLSIDKNDIIIVNQEVDFEGDCVANEEKEIDISLFRPRASYNYGAEECPDDTSVYLFFEDTSDETNELYTPTSVSWSILNMVTGDIYTSDETRINYTIEKDLAIRLVQIVEFENGCIDTLTETFVPGPYPTIDFTTTPRKVCFGDTVSIIDNGNSDWTYTWEPMEGLFFTDPDDLSTALVVGIEDLNYTVTVTDGICTITDSISIEVLEGNNLAVEGNQIICDDQVSLSVSGGIPPGEFQWSLTSDFSDIIEVGDELETSLEGDKQSFFVRYTGETCGDDFVEYEVEKYIFDLLYINPRPVCPGDTFPMDVFNEGDPDIDLTFSWQVSPYLIDGGDSNQPTIGVPTDISEDFTIAFTATNDFGCVFTDEVLFTINERPVIDFTYELVECGKFEVCFSEEDGYIGFPQWDFGDPSTTTDKSIESQPCYTYAGPGVYEVTLKNITGLCAFDDVQKTIVINDDIDIDPIEDQQACLGNTINFTASSPDFGIDFKWYNIDGDLLVTGNEFTGLVNDSYDIVVEATDANGCVAKDTVNISPYEYEVETNIPSLFCNDQEFQVSLTINGETDGYTYNWTPEENVVSGGETANPILLSSGDNTFRVYITDIDTGCEVIEEFQVEGTTFDIELEARPSALINLGESTILTIVDSDPNYTYDWSTGETTPEIEVSPTEDTVYSVTVTDENGCTSTDDITITVRQPVCNETDIFIPNAFTPNGDNINDIFIPRSNFIEEMELVIYNRWGQEVFKTTDPNIGWDGTFNGEKLAPDAFAYYVIIGCINDLSYKAKGDISLMK